MEFKLDNLVLVALIVDIKIIIILPFYRVTIPFMPNVQIHLKVGQRFSYRYISFTV